MMHSLDLASGYKIKQLSKDDINIVEILCSKCSDYYMLCGGDLPSIDEINQIFTDLPPNKNLEDKFVLGVYKSKDLVGIVDIVRDFPTVGEWIIGLLLLEPAARGHGLGKLIHSALVDWAKGLGAKTFRIGVIKENCRALKFWSDLGYTKIHETGMDIVSKSHVIIVMRLKI